MYVDLLMALTPVVVSIYTHHMVKQAATMPDTVPIHAAVLRRELMTTPTTARVSGNGNGTSDPLVTIGSEFATVWGRADPNDPQPEHMEIIGMNGSWQDLFPHDGAPRAHACQEFTDYPGSHQGRRIRSFDQARLACCPHFDGLEEYRQCIYWPVHY